MKKLIITSILAGAVNVSYAALITGDHPYVGANADYLFVKFDHTISQRTPPGAATSAIDYRNGLTGSVDAGYQWITVNNFVYSIETDYRSIDISHTKYGNTSDTTKIFRDNIGLRFGMGKVFLQQFEMLGLIGVDYGRFSFNSRDAHDGSNPFNNDYARPGITFGAGALYELTTHWATRLNYECTAFRHKTNITGDNGRYERDGSTKTNLIEWGISYYF